VAKESSDIVVILDANFASVATVLKWGRCFYINIQKFIQFQLTANVATLMINFIAAVSSGEVPLTAVQKHLKITKIILPCIFVKKLIEPFFIFFNLVMS